MILQLQRFKCMTFSIIQSRVSSYFDNKYHPPGPNIVHLLRESRYEKEKIRNSQREQVVVGRCVHMSVLGDDYAGADVTDDACYEYAGVQKRHGDDYVQRISLGPEIRHRHVGDVYIQALHLHPSCNIKPILSLSERE